MTANRFTMAIPVDWTVLPLDARTRDRRIAGLVEHRMGKHDSTAYLRRLFITQLRKAAAQASDNGAFFAAIHNSSSGGLPLSATAMAVMMPQAADTSGQPLTDPASIAARFAASDGDNGNLLEHSVVDLQVGPAARMHRRSGTGIDALDGRQVVGESVHFYVPLPEARKTLGLLFATPLLAVADNYARLFDAMARTARWIIAEPRTTS